MRKWRCAVLALTVAAALPFCGCGSNGPPFNSTPGITNLFPSNITAGSPAFTLFVVGTGFISTTKGATFVYWNGSPRSTTIDQTTGELMVQIFASDVVSPGGVNVTAVNPAPGGGISNVSSFTVETLSLTAPELSSISPTSAKAGGNAFTLTANGPPMGNFLVSDVVTWNGSQLPTTFVSSSQLTATVPVNDIANVGTGSVAVFTSTPTIGSQSISFPITGGNNPKPSASSLSPSTVSVGSGDTEVIVGGSGFTTQSTAEITIGNGPPSPLALAFISGSQAILLVPAGDLESSGTAMIDISNPAPGGGISSQQTLTIK